MSQDYVIGPNGPASARSNGAALYLPHRRHPAVMIQNTGSASVFCSDEDPITAPSKGQLLTAGSTLGWDADRPLYVTCPTTGTITVTQNSGTLFDVSALASAIAVDLNTSGLAAGIASAIYIQGTPPVDKLTGINDSGVQNANYVSPNIDTSGYQSVSFLFDNTVGTPVTNCPVLLQWFSSTGAPVGTDVFYAGLGTQSTATFPVRGAILIIQIFTVGQFRIYTYGSFKAVDHVTYIGNGTPGAVSGGTVMSSGSGMAGVQTWFGTVPVATAWSWQPDAVAGRCHISLRITATTTAGNSFATIYRSANAFDGGVSIYDTDNAPNNTTGFCYTHEIILPPRPFEIVITGGAGLAIPFRFTVVSERPY